MLRRIEDLKPEEAARLAPWIEIAARHGLTATHVALPPHRSMSSAARRQRQLKAREHKKAEAAKRRLSRTGREWWFGRESWRGGGRGGDRRRWLADVDR